MGKSLENEQEPSPFAQVPYTILDDEQISKRALCVYVALSRFANPQTQQCWPGIKKIAKLSRWVVSEVVEAIRELETLGYIRREHRIGRSTKYILTKQYVWHPAKETLIPVRTANRGCLQSEQVPVRRANRGVCRAEGGCSESGKEQYTITRNRNNNKFNVHPQSNITEYSAAFISFWAAYPRKEGKKAAWRCWKTKLKQGVSEGVLVSAAGNFTKAMEGREKQHIKLPSTFLGPDDHWADFVGDIPEAYQERTKKLDPDQAEKERLLQQAEKTRRSLNKAGSA